jgi:hypothetical protein
MPQPTLFEAMCISVGALSQERLAGATIARLSASLQMVIVAS